RSLRQASAPLAAAVHRLGDEEDHHRADQRGDEAHLLALGVPAEQAPHPAGQERAEDAQHDGEDDADVLLAGLDQARQHAHHEAHQDDPEPAASAEYPFHAASPALMTAGA